MDSMDMGSLPPVGTLVCSSNLEKMFQPHSWYIGSPVRLYITCRLSTVSGLRRNHAPR